MPATTFLAYADVISAVLRAVGGTGHARLRELQADQRSTLLAEVIEQVLQQKQS